MISGLDTLVARLLLVSMIGIAAVHGLSLWTYERALDRELTLAHEMRLAERLVSIKRSVMLVPALQREPVAHDLSGGAFDGSEIKRILATLCRHRGAPSSCVKSLLHNNFR